MSQGLQIKDQRRQKLQGFLYPKLPRIYSALSASHRLLRTGLLLVLAIMPFHAFLSVWFGSLTGHQAIIQAWKEVLIVLLIIPAGLILYSKRSLLRQPLVIAIGIFALLSVLISIFFQTSFTAFILGLKTDLLFLLIFIIGWLTSTKEFKLLAARTLIISSGVVIVFGVLQIFILPNDFLTNFGYSSSTVVPYQLVAGAEDSVRILSTLGGPNQLGVFLILPLCMVLTMLINRPRWWHPLYIAGGLVVEWHTYSRSAWIGLAAAILITIIILLPPRQRLRVAVSAAFASLAAAGILALNIGHPVVEHYVLHGSAADLADSTDLHATALQEGVAYAIKHPLGTGLGSAGPASFYSDKPFIPESYYLQLAAETGLAGLLLFILICILLTLKLWKEKAAQVSAAPVLAALAGVSIVNLFLHGWADSSTALTYWAYAGIVIGSKA